MYAKGGKGSAVPSDSQAREKWLALYVYEYLLHIGAQKSVPALLVVRLLGPVLRSA
uniref:Uncharacterized protein n=1 Tax=Pongo abelii TaxID=9601 RepID=A0A8I5T468_PONAB